MEPSSVMQNLPWRQNLRAGQEKVVALFETQTKVVAQLPTGYGKTLAATCSYLELKHRIGVNRILYIVPRGAQAKQAAEEIPSAIKRIVGGSPRSHVVGDNPITALKAHRKGAAEVFIVTIQSLVSSDQTLTAVKDMMQTGLWMVVIDEHHHYGNAEDSVWAQKVIGLNAQARLAMSATPDRADGISPLGAPDVIIKYLDAWREGAVKELRLHAYEYRVDAINVNGDVTPYTFSTGELYKEVGSDSPNDIERWMASRQMRWSPKYISPLVLHPVERMLDLKMMSIPAQMVIQALSCSHAKMVCEQVRGIIPAGMVVDWVGTGDNGRSDAENAEVLNAFCPPKDSMTGRRRWTLDILVNVGIAGEGLDTTDVCEVVFLTSPNITNSALQTIGRGARTIRGIEHQPTCVINVDAASEFAPHIGAAVMSLFDDGKLTEDELKQDEEIRDRESGDLEYRELPDDPNVGVLDVTLVDIRTDPMFQAVLASTRDELSKSGMSDDQAVRLVEATVERMIREEYRRRDERFNASAIEAQLRTKIQTAVNKVAGLLLRKMMAHGARVERTFLGDLAKRINGHKKKALGPIETATAEELDRHYRWVKQLEAKLLSGELPEWVR